MNELKFDKWVNVLLSLNNMKKNNVSNIGNSLGINWSHVWKIVNIMCQKGLITREVDENNKRTKTITLTVKGQEIKKLLEEIKKLLEENGTRTNL